MKKLKYFKINSKRSKDDTKNKSNILLKKLLWFKNALDNSNHTEMDIANDENVKQTDINFRTKTFLTIQDIHSLIDIYFHRFDDEIDQIKTKNSIGKRTVGQHFSREKAIGMTLETEKNEYESCGISIILKYFYNFM